MRIYIALPMTSKIVHIGISSKSRVRSMQK
jgi:hypothetical protein